MAQDFESTGTQITNSETTLLTANSDDAIIGLRLTNVTSSSVTVDIYIDKGGAGTDRYVAKSLSLPPASSIELIQGGAKIVLQVMDKQMEIESAVLAGPVTFTQTVIVTGTLVIV